MLMRGVTIQGISERGFSWVRFFMEPVIDDGSDNSGTIRARVGAR
ncbi:MAG: hypothetical protein WCB04_03520 [Mycobacteriales bacterium]